MKVVPTLVQIALMVPAAARADTWLVAETPAAVAVSDAQAGVFRPGVMPAVGAYASRGTFAVGLRLRTGVLRDGAAPGNHFRDPSLGSLTTATLAGRVLVSGLWIEGALGGGITGSDVVPAFEAGAGWAFDLGSFELGPSVRLARIASTSQMDSLGNADLLLVGVDMRFGKDRERTPIRRHAPTIEAPPIVKAAPQRIENDHDRIVEHEASCAESFGSPAGQGCTIGSITVVDDRIVLDERVLFDFERARVRSKGREILEQIALLWMVHPEWKSITVEGHADARGSDDFNLELSQRRADNVRDVLVGFGRDPEDVRSIGYGRARPRDTGTDEKSHQRNRRVEFVIERRVEEFR